MRSTVVWLFALFLLATLAVTAGCQSGDSAADGDTEATGETDTTGETGDREFGGESGDSDVDTEDASGELWHDPDADADPCPGCGYDEGYYCDDGNCKRCDNFPGPCNSYCDCHKVMTCRTEWTGVCQFHVYYDMAGECLLEQGEVCRTRAQQFPSRTIAECVALPAADGDEESPEDLTGQDCGWRCITGPGLYCSRDTCTCTSINTTLCESDKDCDNNVTGATCHGMAGISGKLCLPACSEAEPDCPDGFECIHAAKTCYPAPENAVK